MEGVWGNVVRACEYGKGGIVCADRLGVGIMGRFVGMECVFFEAVGSGDSGGEVVVAGGGKFGETWRCSVGKVGETGGCSVGKVGESLCCGGVHGGIFGIKGAGVDFDADIFGEPLRRKGCGRFFARRGGWGISAVLVVQGGDHGSAFVVVVSSIGKGDLVGAIGGLVRARGVSRSQE